jgi:hypothetical protein
MVFFGKSVRKLEYAGVLRNSRSACGPWSGSGTFVTCVYISAGSLVERAQDGAVRFRGLDDDWQRRIAVAKSKCTLPN